MNQHAPHTLVGASMDSMTHILDYRGIIPYFLTQKPKYSVSVHPDNYFSAFILNPTSSGFCNTFSLEPSGGPRIRF